MKSNRKQELIAEILRKKLRGKKLNTAIQANGSECVSKDCESNCDTCDDGTCDGACDGNCAEPGCWDKDITLCSEDSCRLIPA